MKSPICLTFSGGIFPVLRSRPTTLKKMGKEILGLILKENSFQFSRENYQIHGTAMGAKMAVAFANLFLAEIETKMLNESRIKPKAWKRQ